MMIKYNSLYIIIFLSANANALLAQEDTLVKKNNFTMNGYVKNIQTNIFNQYFTNHVAGNIVHSRLNIKWKPSQQLSGAVELRSRFIWDDQIRKTPDYAVLLRNSDEWINLSAYSKIADNMIFHTNLERIWLNHQYKKWNVRVGRQRINWGITNIWNPNDIFNTYNFLDFDYEEKPGSDAVKIQYEITNFNQVEFAFSKSENKKSSILAVKYFFNKAGYDFQIIAGSYHQIITSGFGWAGNIGKIGFKGEGQIYLQNIDSTDFNGTIELTKIFEKGWLLSTAVLFNQKGLNSTINSWNNINFKISPQSLMPAKWTIATVVSKEITPLFNGNITLVYSPKVNMLILFPALKYNIASNIDLDLINQSFFYESMQKFQAISHGLFLRFKWSF